MEGVIPSNWAGDGDHGVPIGGPKEQILDAATHGQTVDSGKYADPSPPVYLLISNAL